MEYVKSIALTMGAEIYEGEKSFTLRFGFNYGGIYGCVIVVEKSGNCYIPEYYAINATPESLAKAIIVLGRLQDHFEDVQTILMVGE